MGTGRTFLSLKKKFFPISGTKQNNIPNELIGFAGRTRAVPFGRVTGRTFSFLRKSLP